MILTSRTWNVPVQSSRCFSAWVPLRQRSHYETLGVSSSSSQADIKSAFYKLSKKHHPDTNVDDPAATTKFQEIAEAYEVLGNEAARKRYDKGMAPVDASHVTSRPGFKAPVDPKAAFYKSRLQNKWSSSPTASRAYNFDEWTKQHYSESLKINKQQATYQRQFRRDKQDNSSKMNVLEKTTLVVISSFIIIFGAALEIIKNQ